MTQSYRDYKISASCTVNETVLERLPAAKIFSEEDGKYVIQAEVFGNGIDMWPRSQEDKIKVIV